MKKKREILANAVNNLITITNAEVVVEDGRLRQDAVISILNERFAVVVKPEITKGNKGIVIMEMKSISHESNLPVLLVTKYIPGGITKEFVDEDINCLDVAGNCNIRQNSLFLLIEGKKIERMAKVNQPRAFQEAGIKLIFQFLVDPEKTQLPYRDLAELADISLGSVGMIMQELMDLNFILKTKQTKKLKNTKDLLNRWITAYHDVLRPRLLKKQMRFINPDSYNRWKDINLTSINGTAFWGGEPAANLLTGYLHPGTYTIYTDQNWHSFKEIQLVPDENGKVEILNMFWDARTCNGVPPILIYADLMSSGSNRNIETAEIIFNNALQYIK